jgi:hypothetical protein
VTKDEREWIKPIPAFLVDILSDHLKLFSFHDEFVFTSQKGLLIAGGISVGAGTKPWRAPVHFE